jgi:hypothetical protein
VRQSVALALALLFAAPSLCAQNSARRVGEGGLRQTTPGDVQRILGALAADSMEGRATGTAGARRAARYIAAEMRRIGLEPIGDSSFMQRVPVSMDSASGARGGRAAAPGLRPRLRASFADMDTVPAGRRRTELNVLGVIRGSDPVLSREVVLIDAHYDHLGVRGPGVGGDSVFNGADDDASGVTAVLEIARQLKAGPPPRRTVVFAAMVGEEVGLIGTNWFIAHPPFPLEQFVANMEIEMIARPDSLAFGAGKAWLTGFERSTMGEILQAAGLPVFPDVRPEQSFFTRSDNIGFARRGIVAHTLSTFNLHADYHRVSDDMSKVDLTHTAGVINVGARAARLLVDGPKPEWKPGGRPEAGRGRGG